MTELLFYHNPRCSKSRQALALLEARGLKPRIVRYLETPPDAATLDRLLEIVAAGCGAFGTSFDTAAARPAQDEVAAMSTNPQTSS